MLSLIQTVISLCIHKFVHLSLFFKYLHFIPHFFLPLQRNNWSRPMQTPDFRFFWKHNCYNDVLSIIQMLPTSPSAMSQRNCMNVFSFFTILSNTNGNAQFTSKLKMFGTGYSSAVFVHSGSSSLHRSAVSLLLSWMP